VTAADQPIPEPGSLWIDNDKRNPHVRYVRVIEIVQSRDPFTHAVIRKARCEAWHDKPGATSRTVHINVDRFRPIATGYRPVPVEGTTTEAGQ
jgi:hypothetical protein